MPASIEETCILLPEQYLWVIHLAFLETWLHAVKTGFAWKDEPMNFLSVSTS